MKKEAAAGIVFAALAAYFFTRGNEARAAQVDTAGQDTSVAPGEADMNVNTTAPTYAPPTASNDADTNVKAFLFTIRASEHRYPNDVTNDAAYHIFYGGKRFYDMSDHPVLTGELKPVPLPNNICAASGLGPGCVSSAAGAYGFIKATWVRLRDKMQLPDFSPTSQDLAAVQLLDDIGALSLIQSGDIQGALKKASKVWASLPGSTAQQNPRTMQYVLDRFAEGLTA
jgi:lysozyme